MQKYDHQKVEKKWQKTWDETGANKIDKDDTAKPKFYLLDMYPYPSGDGLHMGHTEAYTANDIFSRYKKATGFNVLHPTGFDSFGLPAENYAVKTGVHPKETTKTNSENFTRQLKSLGIDYDYDEMVTTSEPNYYKWTQWLFIQFFKNDLVYKKTDTVNWCDSCKTVLANEQVEGGACERCKKDVMQKPIPSWFFKITDFAQDLIDGHEKIDWPEHTRKNQINWIGKSEGAEIEFVVPRVVNDDPNEARSFIMGEKNISEKDINAVGGEIVEATKNGFLCVRFPKSSAKAFEELIVEKMEPGFWNEYLTDDEVVFIFKHKDSSVERLVLSEETDAAIVELGNKFNDDEPTDESAWAWLANNSWYAPIVPKVRVFTTRPDTLFGATYMVLSPEHELVGKLSEKIENKADVDKYVAAAAKKTDLERTVETKEKTGVELKGVKAINPANNEEVPIFIADYVLAHYGTGAIMAVPAHDERDWDFAKQFGIEIRQVIAPRLIQTTEPGAFREGEPMVFRNGVIALVKHWSEDKYIALKWKEVEWGTLLTGGIEDDETPEQTVLKEVREETGFMNAKITRDMGVVDGMFYHVPKKENRTVHGHMFYIELQDDAQEQISDEEEARHSVEWLTLDELKSFLTAPTHHHAVEVFEKGDSPYVSDGNLVNSDKFNDLDNLEAKEMITKAVGGEMKTTYKLRDWSISRQRYWGAPIPIVYDPEGNPHVVPDEHLPWLLPEDVDFMPTGEAPLAQSKELKERTEKIFGEGWTPEVDTMDTFVCSSWYYLRYPDPHNDEEFCRESRLKHWLPVDLYVGGAEHTYLHLMYARFFTKAMQKIGLLDFDEPFLKMRHQGMVLDAEGVKMSKSKGNIVNPDDMVERFGADSVRMYMMFAAPLADEILWNENGIVGVVRFLERVWRLQGNTVDEKSPDAERSLHKLIRKVGGDIEELKFNTAIAAMMSFVNEVEKSSITKEQYATFVRILAPFAPHIAEELWEAGGGEGSVHTHPWPKFDESLAKDEEVTIAVQVNGKVRGSVVVANDSDEATVLEVVQGEDKLSRWLEGEPKKVIFVPNRLINLVL
ncbi:hypothetical protein CL652_02985 [bacterium]|nr:hypothetical protein [bacterium]|tara:strand:- start:27318 stop:30524 length:3207 start_codon:yes stop_codon:yes gene_type:complete